MNHDTVNFAAVAVVVVVVLVIISSAARWFFLIQQFYNDESVSGIRYKEEDDAYNLNRSECRKIFRKNRLCIRVHEEEISAIHDNNKEEDDDNDAYDVETGDKIVLRTKSNSTEKNIGEDETESCSDSYDDHGDDPTTDSENNSVVLRIPLTRIDLFKCSNICVICHEEYKADDEVVFSSNVKCNHVFHIDCMAECISQTKGAKKPCPCCRQCFLDASIFCSNGDDAVVDDERKKKVEEEKAAAVEDGSTTN